MLREKGEKIESSGSGRTPPTRVFVLVTAVSFQGALAVVWVVLSGFLGVPAAEQGRITGAALAVGAAATLPLLALPVWLVHSRLPPLRRLTVLLDETLIPYLSRLEIVDFALISLLAGAGEEGLFRGLLQGGLAGIIHPVAALAAAAVLFGLVHFVTPAYALVAGILGAYLGWLVLVTGNVVVAMTAHGLYDFAALVYLVKIRGRER